VSIPNQPDRRPSGAVNPTAETTTRTPQQIRKRTWSFYDNIVHVDARAYAQWTDFLSMVIYAANQGRSSTSFIIYIGWQWRNVFISYLCQLFFRHVIGQALRSVSITFLISDYTDIVLNQLIQFYSNNATNLRHLTTHSSTILTYKMAIVFRP